MAIPQRKRYKGKTRRLLLAFDIGTTFSGCSYSILDPGKIPEIKTVTRYPAQEQAGGDSKIPTVIYYDKDGAPCAIGAETAKEGIEGDAEEFGWSKAQWSKLHMRPPQANIPGASLGEKEDPLPPLPPNKTVVQVFADFMRYLYQCSKSYISQTHGEKLWASLEDNVIYVLTHPNGWGGPQQGQMRQAAVQAGLVPDMEAGEERVSFVTEGEASLHFCLSNGLAPENDQDGILIVDAGGGTIDLTAYKRCKDKSYTEIAIPKCYFQGSAYVTMRAAKHFKEHLAGSRFEQDVETLMNRFDRNTKPVFKRADESHHIQFAPFRERDPSLNIRNGRLTLSGETIASFFEPSVSKIIVAVKKHCTNAHHPIKTVFLVGGFSASDWLFEKVQEGLKCIDVAVSRPDSHVNKAVSDGAISYYIDGAVSSRVARATYGTPLGIGYNHNDPEHRARSKKTIIDSLTGKPMFYETFRAILERGTAVSATQEFRCRLARMCKTGKTLKSLTETVLSYVGEPKPEGATYWSTEEPGLYRRLCKITADTSNVVPERMTSGGEPYYYLEFSIVLLFGLTEFKAQVVWQEDGVEKRGPASVVYEGDI